MKLTENEVKHIAKLANLKLTLKEVKQLQKQLSETLEYVDKLNKLNTSKIKPTNQVTGLTNIYREDKIEPSFTQEEALSNAKRVYKGYFVSERLIK
jgi:aspartyl-tRNA(Asn)/glutamyl-tRNA(Gln) amidotransferase subunit C